MLALPVPAEVSRHQAPWSRRASWPRWPRGADRGAGYGEYPEVSTANHQDAAARGGDPVRAPLLVVLCVELTGFTGSWVGGPSCGAPRRRRAPSPRAGVGRRRRRPSNAFRRAAGLRPRPPRQVPVSRSLPGRDRSFGDSTRLTRPVHLICPVPAVASACRPRRLGAPSRRLQATPVSTWVPSKVRGGRPRPSRDGTARLAGRHSSTAPATTAATARRRAPAPKAMSSERERRSAASTGVKTDGSSAA